MAPPRGDAPESYTISALAPRFDISTRTIRFYEEKGLISPERATGNQRIYSSRDKARLKLILRGKRFGFSLEEIAEMIGFADAEPSEIDQIKKGLAYGEKKLAEIRHHIAELRLLEEDLLTIRDRLMKRLAQITESA